MDTTTANTSDENDVLASIVKLAADIMNVPMAGFSTVGAENENCLVGIGFDEKEIDVKHSFTKRIFDNNGIYIYEGERSSGNNIDHINRIKFYAGVEVKNDKRMLMGLWVQDTKIRNFTQREESILKNLASWAGYVFSTSTKITSRDAQKIMNIQRELYAKNRDLAEADARRKAMLENIGDGVVGIDGKGNIIYTNPAIEDLVGWKKDELEGKFFIHAFLLLDEKGTEVPAERRPIRNALYKNIRVESKRYYLQRKDGSKFAAAITATPVSLFGQIIGGVNVIRDITKEKEIDKMKTEFISLASHQLRTPLSSVKWFTEMLLDGDIGEMSAEQKDIIESIYQSNERMIVLVNTLLNISRIESGRIIIEPETTDISGLVDEVVAELKPKILEKNHKVEMDIEKDLPKINIDPRLVRHVYLNLLTNAIKYTNPGGNIKVKLAKSGNELISTVQDTGLGIPQEDQEKIFSKFFRAKNVVKIETEGTGLGLYLVNTIVQSTGGKIWFESEEGKGTKFTFVLPLTGVKAKKGEVRLS